MHSFQNEDPFTLYPSSIAAPTLDEAAPGTVPDGSRSEGGYTAGEPHPTTLRGSGEFGDPLRIEPVPLPPGPKPAGIPADTVFKRYADVRASADTPFAIVVSLLREAVRLAAIGDITPGMDDGIGWGAWMTDAEDTLGRLRHVPELAPLHIKQFNADQPRVPAPMKPSEFRKSRSEFGQSDVADALAYALAAPPKPHLIHRQATDTAPPPGAEPEEDEAPLMISCDSEYRAAEKGDEHDWCNRTFVARIGDTIVASLNVMGYDDDAFDLARCAAAAWEADHKSFGPIKADDLLALGNRDAQKNGAWVSKAMYDEATATLVEVCGLLEKACEDNVDCKTYMVEVFHDALRWLEGKMERVPEPDYGERIAGARRELNCALAAMGNPVSARKHAGMHHAASHLLFGMGWGWRASEGYWSPGKNAAKVFRDRVEVEALEVKAARWDRIEGAYKIDGQHDYGRIVHVLVTRGSDGEHPHVNYNNPPATLEELADQIRAVKS